MKKAERAKKRKQRQVKMKCFPVPGQANMSSKNKRKTLQVKHRTPIPATIKHQVYLRDKGQCQWQEKHGHICGSQKYVELHHLKPIAQGGEHTLDNLVSLCSGHHKSLHFLE